MQNNIILCGFMGCGKTTVGKLLADKLGYTLIDTDAYIEQKENMSIAEIFAKNGEPYFRAIETEVAATLSQEQGLVIATGGGLMLNPENADNLNKTGVSFWIKISPETVLSRLKNDTTRPLLQRDDKESAIKKLMAEREPIYAKHCRFSIDGENSPEKLADLVASTFTKANTLA